MQTTSSLTVPPPLHSNLQSLLGITNKSLDTYTIFGTVKYNHAILIICIQTLSQLRSVFTLIQCSLHTCLLFRISLVDTKKITLQTLFWICPKIDGSLPSSKYDTYFVFPKNWLIIAELVFIYWLYSKSWASQLSFMKNWEVSVFLVVWTSTKNILYDDYHDFCIENWSLYSSLAIKIAFLSLCLSKFQKLRASFFMV